MIFETSLASQLVLPQNADLALGLWAGPREGPLWGLGLLGRGAPGPNRAPKGPGDPGAPTKRPKPHLSQRAQGAQGPPLNLIFFGLWELIFLGLGPWARVASKIGSRGSPGEPRQPIWGTRGPGRPGEKNEKKYPKKTKKYPEKTLLLDF